MAEDRNFDHRKMEQKWQKYWEENKTFAADLPPDTCPERKRPCGKGGSPENSGKSKYYVLDMFPYPSGAGLHVGHPEGYTATDIIARYKRMRGYNVLHPMGWDAFGLPAENYAIKTGEHPEKTTRQNIATFKRQIQSLGFSYDWSREFATTDSEYYRWTQWIFLQMYKKGLLYEKAMPMNWCPQCRIVAANEEVENGCHERCGAEVEKRNLTQWLFRITDYAERLLNDLEKPNVVLLHGWEGNGHGGWFTEMADFCREHGIGVLAPDMPNAAAPKYEEWKTHFEENILPHVSNRTILLGHSLGGTFIQKYLSENDLRVAEILLVAPGVKFRNIEVLENFYTEPFDYEKIRHSADNIFLFAGGKDQFIPEADFRFLAEKLDAHLRFFPDEGHFNQSKYPTNPFVKKHFEGIADSLLDWPDKIIAMQKNWIGKSEGIEIEYPAEEMDENIICYTTRPDTNFGATFVVLAPEHEFLGKHLDKCPNRAEVEKYIREAEHKSDIDRMAEGKKKTGVFTGLYVRNRLNDKKLPLYVGDFVLANVGTGAVVGVPGHDLRDFEFAQAMDIEVIRVVVAPDGDDSPIERPEQVQEAAGTIINSEFLNGLEIMEAKERIMDHLVEKGYGTKKTNYKLRDWIFTRQRYWGEPIPLVRDEAGDIYPLDESELPVTLPQTDNFLPTEDGKSPLAKVAEWVEVRGEVTEDGSVKLAKDGTKKFFRETSTMPNWAGSNWYWLRFMDARNENEPWSKQSEEYWGPVDLYVGGAEHAVLHLLYSRFWHKVFYDMGLVSTKEPFKKLMNQGLILAEDGQKMSKSLGNVVNPDEIVNEYGADTLRMYEMFMGPFEQSKAWNTGAVEGMHKFLQKIWKYCLSWKEMYMEDIRDSDENKKLYRNEELSSDKVNRLLNKSIKKVTQDIESFKFNTAISQLMIFLNSVRNESQHRMTDGEHVIESSLSIPQLEKFIKTLSPFAPHLAEEIWHEVLGNSETIAYEPWPEWDEALTVDETIQLAVQVNGKLRATIEVSADIAKEEALQLAKEQENVKKFLEGKQLVKEIFVPGKIVNLVVR